VDFTQYARRCATVREAVEDAARRTGKPKYEVAYELMMSVKRGELAVESGADSALAYVLGPGGIWLWLVLGLAAASAALALLAAEPPLLYLRYVLGTLFVLFLPGYALVEALYPRGDELSPLERLALSIGLSLAVVPLVGLVLNYTPFGIRLEPVVASLAALTAALAVYAAYRKYRTEALAAVCRAT
jgi:peptidoglycan/LPS O-acetylase OafA/YrhL